MTQRERHASAGASAIVAAPAALATPAAPPASRPGAEVGHGRPALWEDFYRAATPAQQHELLTLAGRQGLLYAHQLPPPANGTRPAPDDPRHLRLLNQLLAGQTADLHPAVPAPVTTRDAALDAHQRDAVARAVGTPDLCLIQGLPGSGKSRVAAEVIAQAAARGERVLLLAPAAPALDRILELVQGHDALCAVRCLGRDESPEHLPPAARAATLAERGRALREHTLRCAHQARRAADQRCQQRRQEELLWPRLLALAEEHQSLAVQHEDLARRRAAVPGEVRAQADGAEAAAERSPFQADWHQAAQAHRDQLAALDARATDLAARQATKRQELDLVNGQLAEIQPLADAKQQGRWWSPTWWKASFQGDVATRVAELEAQKKAHDHDLANLDAEAQALAQQRRDAVTEFGHNCERRLDAETTRRYADLDRERGHLDRHQAQLRQLWEKLLGDLHGESQAPATLTAAAVHEAQAAWQARCAGDEEACAFAAQWADHLEEGVETLAARLPHFANLVAATTAGWPAGAPFADPADPAGQFDLLVVEEADHVTESEFVKAARRARRWVLFGEPAAVAPAPRGAGLARAAVFPRLWLTLHCDPARLPYAWFREDDRFGCRLRPVAPEQRQWLERESLADFPEIELRILALPRVRPALAEVVFPASLTIHQAKEFIYRELQELAVQAPAAVLRWREDEGRLVAALGEHLTPHPLPVELEPGVREILGTPGPHDPDGAACTCRIEFDPAAGWTRERAEEWLHEHLAVRDWGRTALLETPHRMAAPLGDLVLDLLFAGRYRAPAGAAPNGAVGALEFVAVPPQPRRREAGPGRDHSRRREAHGPNRGGAGLEVDLAAGRPTGDRLPADLRHELPGRGLVNFFEAQAVVRKLEDLMAAHKTASLAVIALYPAQAELIRQLVRRSPKLAPLAAGIPVDVAGAFRQREFDVVLVSLTRSHTHRAVAYGDGPATLFLALTRARHRLVVFGDVGTLARRIQWEGALDHLDEAAAAVEGRLLADLHYYVHGQGAYPNAFLMTEGVGA